ncbi:MAG: aminotransferase class I/II-fold pyridoxal phosphate-dependent enzyme [Microcoleaceae cyanobacterium]
MPDPTQIPLLHQLKILAQRSDTPFYAPGHKRGQGITPALQHLLGTQVFQADLPELPELDNLFSPEGVIQQAQELAAVTFGAEKTWFLTNGSTAGIIAAILATCGDGDKIIVPRNVHQSVISGLILSGATAVFISPEYDATWDLISHVTPETIRQALEQHPDTAAVLIVSPTYQGICSDIQQIAALTHQYKIPLIVDEAHGSHFGFHPDLPQNALSLGADIAVQSIHKVLGAMTQASMLHIQGQQVDCQRLNQALSLVQSTSPSYLLLASLDAARYQMATQGKELMERTLHLAQTARIQLQDLSLQVLQHSSCSSTGIALDPTRLTVRVSDWGLSGYEVDEILHQQFQVTAELPSLRHLTFIISLGNRPQDIEKLVQGFKGLLQSCSQTTEQIIQFPSFPITSRRPVVTVPRSTFFSPSQLRSPIQAIGQLSADCICPYPPGIPLLMPGEPITAEALNYLQHIIALGGKVTGAADPKLKTLRIQST